MEACGTDAGRDAIVVGRQLGVVLLEHVQPLGSPIYGIVSPAELVLPLPLPRAPGPHRPCRASGGAARRALRSPRSAPGICRSTSGRTWRGVVPAASRHIVVRVRHLDSKPRRTFFGPRRVRLRWPLPPLLFAFYFRGAARIRRFSVRPFRSTAARGFFALPPFTSISDHLGNLLAPLHFPLSSRAWP